MSFLFDNNNLNAPPDIILDDNIGFDKECEKSNIINYSSIISQWNVKDENCLINIVNNIKNSFKVITIKLYIFILNIKWKTNCKYTNIN